MPKSPISFVIEPSSVGCFRTCLTSVCLLLSFTPTLRLSPISAFKPVISAVQRLPSSALLHFAVVLFLRRPPSQSVTTQLSLLIPCSLLLLPSAPLSIFHIFFFSCTSFAFATYRYSFLLKMSFLFIKSVCVHTRTCALLNYTYSHVFQLE